MPCVYNATGSHHPLAEFFEAIQKDVQDFHGLKGDDQFVPEVDIFDTPEAFILHVSLPGAVREDIGLEFDAVCLKSELPTYIKKLTRGRAQPAGHKRNPDIRSCSSQCG